MVCVDGTKLGGVPNREELICGTRRDCMVLRTEIMETG